jgi:peptidoglycan/xylan/chitin deacetylase (PgdA/CDA1 family)
MKGIWRRRSDRRRWVLESVIGLAMLPLSLVPIWLYATKTDDGYLMYLRGRYSVMPPSTPRLSAPDERSAQLAAATSHPGVPVLVYHGIGRAGSGDEGSGRYTLDRSLFAEQLRSLQAAGYEAITTRDLAVYLRSANPSVLPRKPVLITFDDGRSDAMIQADPILKATGFRATMFVIGASASHAGFYYEDAGDLAARRGSGRWELASHTFDLHATHDEVKGRQPIGALVDLAADEGVSAYRARVRTDLDREDAALHEMGQKDVTAFAYPFGDWGERARPGVAQALAAELRRRYALAFDQDHHSGWRPVVPGDDPHHLHRLSVGRWSGPELLGRLERAGREASAVYGERGYGGWSEGQDAHASLAAATTGCTDASRFPIRSVTPAAGEKLIALTFDDGPSVYTAQIANVRVQARAQATYVVDGRHGAGHERLLRRLAGAGMELGSLGWSHADPARLSRGAIRSQLTRASEALGRVPASASVARPPYGHAAARFAGAAAAGGRHRPLVGRPGRVRRRRDRGADRVGGRRGHPARRDRLAADDAHRCIGGSVRASCGGMG